MVTSLHCVGMCGPIACGLSSLAKSDTQRLTGTALYHSGRVLSYGLIGAICGAVGRAPLEWFFKSPAVVLPWVLVAVLLMMGLGIDKLIPQPAFVARLTTRARFKAMRLSPPAASAAMGLLSPFLPCAPLYAVFLATLTASSAVRGAELLVAFALGTVPLLWVAQWGFAALGLRRGPQVVRRIQRGLAVVAALVIAWRLHDTIPPQWYGAEPPPAAEGAAPTLPSCCH
jgi:hypothetical protein